MAEETVTKPTADTDSDLKTWKRRGLLAAAAAVVAGIVAKLAEAPVLASSGGGDQGFLALGSNPWYNPPSSFSNTPAIASAPTVIQASPNFGNFVGANGADTVLFEVDARASGGSVTGIYSFGTGSSGIGVFTMAPYVGVWATSSTAVFANGSTTGVLASGGFVGLSANGPNGVFASGTSGNAVRGEVQGSANTIAIYGLNNSSYAGPGPGAGGFGVYGLSAKGHGLVGATATAGAGAVVGATNGVAGAYAGVFYGPVIVGGDFTVFGAKSAAVPHPDGSHRRLYCMESPESWFEDFGEQQLECGQAEVTLDPDFAAVVNPEHYQVFITQYGGHDDLPVVERTPRGFRVEAREATSAARFGWRTVAKRKDIVGERLAAVTIPPAPQLPPVPSPDDAHVPPDIRSRMVRQ